MLTKKIFPDEKFLGPQKSGISVVMKVPGLNNLGKNNKCRNAGNAVLVELRNIFSSEKGKLINVDLLDLEEIHVNNDNLDEQEELIYKNSLEALDENEKVIFLGGDHSISYNIGKAFLENCKKEGKEPCLIIFDAHADCMEPMKNPTHEEWLRALVDSGFPAENILLVGNRNVEKQELIFLNEKKIKRISMNELNNNIEDVTDTIMEFGNGKRVYVSFDIDVVDPVFASETGYPEVGGLTSRQIIYIVQRLALMKNLKAFDLVEINCEKPEYNNTVKLGAKLLGELL